MFPSPHLIPKPWHVPAARSPIIIAKLPIGQGVLNLLSLQPKSPLRQLPLLHQEIERVSSIELACLCLSRLLVQRELVSPCFAQFKVVFLYAFRATSHGLSWSCAGSMYIFVFNWKHRSNLQAGAAQKSVKFWFYRHVHWQWCWMYRTLFLCTGSTRTNRTVPYTVLISRTLKRILQYL